jgi:hypothetical protein
VNEQATPVLVLYESSRDGHAALRHALALARGQGTTLTVLANTPIESLETGCLRCRGATARWNEALCEVAVEELADARMLLGDADGVEYLSERGRPREAIARAVRACGAGTIVVAGRRGPRLRRSLRRLAALRLRPAGCELLLAAPAARRARPAPRGARPARV